MQRIDRRPRRRARQVDGSMRPVEAHSFLEATCCPRVLVGAGGQQGLPFVGRAQYERGPPMVLEIKKCPRVLAVL